MNNNLVKSAAAEKAITGPRTSDLIQVLTDHVVPAHKILFSEHPEIAAIGQALTAIYQDRPEVPVFVSFVSGESPLMSSNPVLRKFSAPEIQLLLDAPGQASSISLDIDKVKFLTTFVLSIAIHALHNAMLDQSPELAVRHIFGDGSTEDIVRLAAADDDEPSVTRPNTARGTRVTDVLVRQVTPQAYRNATLQDLIDATSAVAYRGLLTACSARNFGNPRKDERLSQMARMSKAVMSAGCVRYYERQLEATRSMLQQGRRAKLRNGLQLVSNPPIGPFMNGNSYYWRAVGDKWTDPAFAQEGPRDKVAGMAFVSWAGAPHQLPDSLRDRYEQIYARDLESYFVGLTPDKVRDIVGLDPSTSRSATGAHREFSAMFAANPTQAKTEVEGVLLRGFNVTVDALASNGPQIEKFVGRFPALRDRGTYEKISQAAAKLVALISVNPPTEWASVTPVCQSAMDQVTKQMFDGDANGAALLAKVATIAMELPIDLDTHVSNVDLRSAITPKLDLYGKEPPRVNVAGTPIDIFTTMRILAPHQKGAAAGGVGFVDNISRYNYEPGSLAMRIDSLFAKQENEAEFLAYVLEIGRALTVGEKITSSQLAVKRAMGMFAHAVAHVREKISVVIKNRGIAVDKLEQKIAALQNAKATSAAMTQKNNYELAKAQDMLAALQAMGTALGRSNPDDFAADFCVSVLDSALQIVATTASPIITATAKAAVARGGAVQLNDIAEFCKLAYAQHPFTRGQLGAINIFNPVVATDNYNTLTDYQNVVTRGIARSGPESVDSSEKTQTEFAEYRISSHAVADLLETNHFAKRLPENEQAAKNDLAAIYGQGDATKSMLIASVESKTDELLDRSSGRSLVSKIVGEAIDRDGQELAAIQRFMMSHNRQTIIKMLVDLGLDADYYDALMLALSRKVASDMNFMSYTAEKLARRYTFIDKTETQADDAVLEGGVAQKDEEGATPAPSAGGGADKEVKPTGVKGKDSQWRSIANPIIVAEMQTRVEEALLTPKVTRNGRFEQYCGAGFFSEFFAKAEMAEGGGDQADIAQKYVNRIRPRSGTGSSTKFAGLLRKRMIFAVGASFGRQNSMRVTALLRQHAAEGAVYQNTGKPLPTTQADVIRDLWETSEEDSRIYCDPWHAAIGLASGESSDGDSFRKALDRALTGVGPIATSEDASYPEVKEKLQQYFAYKRKALMDKIRVIADSADRDFMVSMLAKAPAGGDVRAGVYAPEELQRLKIIGAKIEGGQDAVDESARKLKIALETVFQSDWWRDSYAPVLLGMPEVKAAKLTTAREIASRIRADVTHVQGFEVELARLPADSRNSPLHALKNSIDKLGLVFAGAAPRHNYASESPRAKLSAAMDKAITVEAVREAVSRVKPAGSMRILQGQAALNAIRKDTRAFYAVQAKIIADNGSSFIVDSDPDTLAQEAADALVDFIESGDATASILQGVAMDTDSAEYRNMGRADVDDVRDEQSVAVEAALSGVTFKTDEDFYTALAEQGFLSQEGVSLVRAAKGAERILPENFGTLPAAQAVKVMRERVDALKALLSRDVMTTSGGPMDMTWRGQVRDFQSRQSVEFRKRVAAKMNQDDTLEVAKATQMVQRELRSEFARRDIKLAESARDALDKVLDSVQSRAAVPEAKAKFVSMATNNLTSVPGLNQALVMAGMLANYSLAAGRPTAVTKQYYEDGVNQFDQALMQLDDHINNEMGSVGKLIATARATSKQPTLADLEAAVATVASSAATSSAAKDKFEELVSILKRLLKDRTNAGLQQQATKIIEAVKTENSAAQIQNVIRAVMSGATPTWDSVSGTLSTAFEDVYGETTGQSDAPALTQYVKIGGEKMIKLIATLNAVDIRKAEYATIRSSLASVSEGDLAMWRDNYATFKAKVEPDTEAEQVDTEDEAEVEDISREMSEFRLDVKPTNIEYGKDKEQAEAAAIKEVNKVSANLLSAIENSLRTMESVPGIDDDAQAEEYKAQLMRLVADVRGVIADPRDAATRKLTSSTSIQNFIRTIAQICAATGEDAAIVDVEEAKANFDKLRASPDADEVVDTGEFSSMLSIGVEFGAADEAEVELQIELGKQLRAFMGRVLDYLRSKAPNTARASAQRVIQTLDVNNMISPDPINLWFDGVKKIMQRVVRDSDEGIDVGSEEQIAKLLGELGQLNVSLREEPVASIVAVTPPPLPLRHRTPAAPADEPIELAPDDIVELEGDADEDSPDASLHSLEGEVDHLIADLTAIARSGGERTRPMLKAVYALHSRLRDAPRVDVLTVARDTIKAALNQLNQMSPEQQAAWMSDPGNIQQIKSAGGVRLTTK